MAILFRNAIGALLCTVMVLGANCINSAIPSLNDNQSPVAHAGSDQQASPLRLVILNGSGSIDPDGDLLTYTWKQTAGRFTVDLNTTGNAAKFLIPAHADPGETLTFELTVSDNQSEATDTTRVIVQPAIQ